MNISALMDAARQRAQIRSDRHMAMRVDVSPSAMSAWRKGYAVPLPEHLITLCELAEIPPEVGLAWRNAWQAEGKAKSICTRIAKEAAKTHGVALPSEAA